MNAKEKWKAEAKRHDRSVDSFRVPFDSMTFRAPAECIATCRLAQIQTCFTRGRVRWSLLRGGAGRWRLCDSGRASKTRWRWRPTRGKLRLRAKYVDRRAQLGAPRRRDPAPRPGFRGWLVR